MNLLLKSLNGIMRCGMETNNIIIFALLDNSDNNKKRICSVDGSIMHDTDDACCFDVNLLIIEINIFI